MRHDDSGNKFTLIEMLVVISIIAILAAMLSPSLMKALESARGVACANNAKQLGIAFHTYASSYQDAVCPGVINGGGWKFETNSFDDVIGNGYTWDRLLAEEDNGESVPLHLCPSNSYATSLTQDNESWWQEITLSSGKKVRGLRSYVMPQAHWNGISYEEAKRTKISVASQYPPNLYVPRIGRLPSVSTTAVLFESHTHDNPWEGWGCAWQLTHGILINPKNFTSVHNGKNTVTLADGHVKTMLLTEAVGTGEFGIDDGDIKSYRGPKGIFTTTPGD